MDTVLGTETALISETFKEILTKAKLAIKCCRGCGARSVTISIPDPDFDVSAHVARELEGRLNAELIQSTGIVGDVMSLRIYSKLIHESVNSPLARYAHLELTFALA